MIVPDKKKAEEEIKKRKLEEQRKELTKYGRELAEKVKKGMDPAKALDLFYQKAASLTGGTNSPRSNALLIAAASSHDIRGIADIGGFGSDDSAHHFFFAAFNTLDNPVPTGGWVGVVGDIIELGSKSSDWEQDMLANEAGAAFGDRAAISTNNPLNPSADVAAAKNPTSTTRLPEAVK